MILAGPTGGPSRWVRRPLFLLGTATLVDSAGSGLFFSAAAVFYSRYLGLSATQIGLGMSIAGVASMILGTPLAGLADRVAARTLRIIFDLSRAVAILGFLLVHGFVTYALVLTLVFTLDRANATTFQMLVGGLVSGEQRIQAMARLRVAFNVGYTLGALGAGLALLRPNTAMYQSVVAADSLTFLLAALLISRIPAAARTGAATSRTRDRDGWRAVTRDRWYLALTGANGVLCLHETMVGTAIPVWVATLSDLPAATVPALAAVNTVMAVALQVRATRGTTAADGAARALTRTAWVLGAGCAAMALADASAAWWLVLTFAAASMVLATGAELLQSAGAWTVAYEFAPEADRGKYLSVFDLGVNVQRLAGPALLTVVVLPAGPVGWVALGALLACSGFAVRFVVARCRDRLSTDTVPSGNLPSST